MGLEKEKKLMEYIPLCNFVRLSEYRKAHNIRSLYIGPEECEGDVETPLSPELCRDGASTGITPKELGIIQLGAQIMALFGEDFWWDLKERFDMHHRYSFLHSETDPRTEFFNWLVASYEGVFMRVRLGPRCSTESFLDVFSRCFPLDGVDTETAKGMIDLNAFVGGVDSFAYMDYDDYSAIMPRPQGYLDMLLNQYHDIQPDDRLPLPSSSKISLVELGIIKLTAQFEARYGSGFMNCLRKTLDVDPRFEILQRPYDRWPIIFGQAVLSYGLVLNQKLKKSDDCVAVVEFYLHRLQWEKLEKLEKGVETAAAMTDLLAFAGGVDCFAHMDIVEHSAYMPRPEGLLKMMSRLTQMQPDVLVRPPAGARLAEYGAQNQGVTHERAVDAQPDLEPPPPSTRGSYVRYRFPDWTELMELGIMKLTALFVARYGIYFCWALMKKTVMKPQFKFMEPNDSKFSVYNGIVGAYEGVVKPLRDACTATALDAFFDRLQLEKLEEGSETAMIDLHAFLSGVDYFALVEDDGYSTFMPQLVFYYLNDPSPYDQFACCPSMGMIQPAPPMPGMSPHPPFPLPEEPQPKRQKCPHTVWCSRLRFFKPFLSNL